MIAKDEAFARSFAAQDAESYLTLAGILGPHAVRPRHGPESRPEELMRLRVPALVVPGHHTNHASSAARYLEECLSQAEYWDVMLDEQSPATIKDCVVEFLSNIRKQ